jgi:hypothetical protein
MLNRATIVARLAKLEKRVLGVGAMSSYATINIITRDGIETSGPPPEYAAVVINLTIGLEEDEEPDPEPEPANLHRLY